MSNGTLELIVAGVAWFGVVTFLVVGFVRHLGR